MDNAFAAVDDVAALQAICHALGPEQTGALLRKWLARLPHPFSPADLAAGYRYDISVLHAMFLTRIHDGSCQQDSPNSPDRTQHPCAKPSAPTRPPSTSSLSEQE